jgi:hypothetical protein
MRESLVTSPNASYGSIATKPAGSACPSMSAFAPKATEIAWRCNMSRRATNGLMQCSNIGLFDHIGGEGEQ